MAVARASHLNVQAGASFSNYVSGNAPAATTRAGAQAGVLLRLPVGHNFSVQPEFLYTQKRPEMYSLVYV